MLFFMGMMFLQKMSLLKTAGRPQITEINTGHSAFASSYFFPRLVYGAGDAFFILGFTFHTIHTFSYSLSPSKLIL